MKRWFFLALIVVLTGCATARPSKVLPSVADNAGPVNGLPAVSPTVIPVPEMQAGPAGQPPGAEESLSEESVPSGAVFGKTVFEGVVKTSYVQLGIVNREDPEKTFQLIIGDKARQKNLPWNIQTVSPGYFFISLPPGRYQINSITIPVATTLATEPMDVLFEVEPDQTVYLGTMEVRADKERIKVGGVPIIRPGFEYVLDIRDERGEALKELRTRFPADESAVLYRLMRVGMPGEGKTLSVDDNS